MRLLKREVETVTTKELNYRYCHLLEKGERIPAHKFSIAEAREILWIEDELHQRVIRVVGHDFYPPDQVEEKKLLRHDLTSERKQPLADVRALPQAEALRPNLKPEIPKSKPDVKIKFNIVVTSSIGTKAAKFSVDAVTKAEVDALVQKEIQKLGLRRATYKIK